jgi:hypothetical protein
MLSELWAFLQVGFHHIVALDAADHILFLLVLAAIYRGRDWRSALWVISATDAHRRVPDSRDDRRDGHRKSRIA